MDAEKVKPNVFLLTGVKTIIVSVKLRTKTHC